MRPVEGDLYEGSAGIAVFLADAFALTGDRSLSATAVGAVRHALGRAFEIEPRHALGLYCGRLGTALAAMRVGVISDEPSLASLGDDLADHTLAHHAPAVDHDVVAGRAGGILALLLLAEMRDAPRYVAAARRLGSQLLESAHERAGALSWPFALPECSIHPTGLAHGAAGIGLAFLELHAATGEDVFLDAARGAFAHERLLYDRDAGNWRDLRRTAGASFACAWCNGAPGIALTRARAIDLVDDAGWRAETVAGMETTAAFTRAMLGVHGFDFTLCDGIAGNAWALLESAELAGRTGSPEHELAAEAAEAGLRRYARSGRWPCDPDTGSSSGLMTGTAGIGAFLLRSAGAPVWPVVLPRSAHSGASTQFVLEEMR